MGNLAASPPQPRLSLDGLDGSLGLRVYLVLKQAILSLAFAPGEMLRKPDICAALGVSRSPVSDALARLAAEGLVEILPQAGTFVARFSMAEIREGAFLREAIETAAAERVAATITPAQVADLRQTLDRQAAAIAAQDAAAFYALDGEMHRLILSFTGYRRLAQVAETAWLHVNRARQLVLPIPGRIAATLDEHQAIVDALAARDPVAARAAVQFHLRQLLTFIEPLERDRPDLFSA
jgi:DNA-binding GntR family transcriptional regulator